MILLQAQEEQSMLPMILMVVGLIAFFYFTSIRPQQKKAKEAKSFKESLNKGNKVVTEGGIHGTIVKVEEDVITIEVESGARMKVEADQISNDRTALRYKK
jgi:preprotein translocase subunit YajC